MQDSTSAILKILEQNLAHLHSGLEASRPIIENLKAVLALQWFLGNLAIVALFLIGLRIYFFDVKALKLLRPDYKIPKRWIATLGISFIGVLLAFNIFPLGIDLKVDSPFTNKAKVENHVASESGN